ncbi:MAG: MFS transporter, partial [Acidimicrobiales bacterium]
MRPEQGGRGSLLGHGDFRLLWLGQTVSVLGSQVTLVALPLAAVVVLHASTFQVGLLTAASTLAFLVIGLPAGAWVDRARRRPVMVADDLVRAAVLTSVPVAAAVGGLTMAQLYAVALVAGVCTVFFDVAYQSYLPALVGRERLVEGNARLETTQAMARVGGPTLGGFLVQLLSAPRSARSTCPPASSGSCSRPPAPAGWSAPSAPRQSPGGSDRPGPSGSPCSWPSRSACSCRSPS